MDKVVCLPSALLPSILSSDTCYFSMYSVSNISRVGYVASQLRTHVARAGLRPDVNTWDFTTFALSVSAADKAISRATSPNGWTRQINLLLAVHNVPRHCHTQENGKSIMLTVSHYCLVGWIVWLGPLTLWVVDTNRS